MAVCSFEIGKFDAAEKLFITVIRKSLDKKKKMEVIIFSFPIGWDEVWF